MKPEKHTIRRQKAKIRRAGKRACFVYGLRLSGKVYYVGQTRCALPVRLKFHNRSARPNGSPVQRWLLDCWPLLEGVEIFMLEENAVWDVDEIIWIERMRQKGEPLLNVKRGGKD